METKLNVSSIQHFSTGDGDGIRTTVFLKGCHLRCPWCHNPETWSPKLQTLYYPAANKSVDCGKMMSVEEIAKEVLTDKDFYVESKGGLTISGGEPLLDPNGVATLAQRISREGISVIIDTSACVAFEAFEKVADFCDRFFIDFKASNEEDYKNVIKGNFQQVCENIRCVAQNSWSYNIRIPLIPGFNTGGEYVDSMIEQLLSLGVKAVDLLPFHRLGSGKYKALGMNYPYEKTKPLTPEELDRIAEKYKKYFKVKIEK